MGTIVDSYGHAIVTLTERSANFILIEKLPQGRKALPTARAMARLLFPYRKYVKTITTDNGCEFAAHIEITNTPPKKSDFNDFTDRRIMEIQKKINRRPKTTRKTEL